ncbi:DUF2332 domain-containing protein [Yunchengibacter salinarum]|uniref:DUF2332 domain-containing protein n=1 Tax=Yunchengibacter salinarum TaxID=3133399 RepID=UPI0035B69C63
MNTLIDALAHQADWADRLGSPFVARLCRVTAAHGMTDPVLARLVAPWARGRRDPVADALPLRLAGALHHLVLAGTDDDLAALFPPNDPPDGDAAFWLTVRTALSTHEDAIANLLDHPPQTNEVQRSAVLLPGLLTVADRCKLPIRLLEPGASAGLNLLCDRFFYRFLRSGDDPPAEWGQPRSETVITPEWSGPLPPLSARLDIRERRGVDLHPLDLRREAHRLTLMAYIWPDQIARLRRVKAAMDTARARPVALDTGAAAPWLASRLGENPAGWATVVMHSIFWPYLSDRERMAIEDSLEQAGEKAGPRSPLAWLRFEPERDGETHALSLTLWRGDGDDGVRKRLAVADPHCNAVQWLA